MPASAPSFITPRLFADAPGVVAGFTRRHGGASGPPFDSFNLGLSTGDEREVVQENRRRLAEALGFAPDALVIAGQVHGDRVLEVSAAGLYPGYDGIVTRTPGLLLCITAADCAAVLLADVERGTIGACHSGWRGTEAEIVKKTVAGMERLGARPEALHAYISPCISAEHFEVGPEVAERFDDRFVRRLPGRPKPHVDLKAALEAQLREAGVPPEGVEVDPGCTFAQTDEFFSYRAEAGRTGRMMGFIGLRP